MDLRTGYKHTEVGVIPNAWVVTTLGDLVSYTNGKAHEKHISNSGDSGPFIVVNSKFISTEGLIRKFSDHPFCPASKGDVLMVMSDIPNGRAIAKCYYVKSDDTYTVNQRICLLTPHRIGGKFLFYILDRNPFYLAFDDGVKQTNLRKDEVLSCPLGIPKSTDEQCAIATALSDTDELLSKLDQLVTKKRDLKQAAMQQLLTGQSRLPGFSGEWKAQSIESLEASGSIRLSRGKVISKKDIASRPGDYPIYSSSVQGDGLFGRYGEYMFDEEMITWSVDGGGHFFYRPRHRFSVTNVCGYMRIDNSKINYRFLAAQLQHLHSELNFDYQDKAHPSVIRKAYVIKLPLIPEQVAIATILFDMDTEIATLESRRDKTRAIKQGMMQELLTGRIRLV